MFRQTNVIKFPVFFPVTRENSSHVTALSAIQSALVILYTTFRLKYGFAGAECGDVHL